MNDDYEGKNDPIGVRMKEIEAKSLSVSRIDGTSPFIVRLDGSKFSTLTKSLEKPFDVRFYNSMLQTTKDLVEKFKAVTGYSHSDEITLIFANATTQEEIDDFVSKGKQAKTHLNNGRVVKLLTMMAGYCSVRFNVHSIDWNKKQSAFFDARLLVFDSVYLFENTNNSGGSLDPPRNEYPDTRSGSGVYSENLKQGDVGGEEVNFPAVQSPEPVVRRTTYSEIVNHALWRSCRDSIRNCVSAYGRHILGVKGVFGLNSGEIIEKMLKEKQFDFLTEVPIEYRHGVYIKKELMKGTNENGDFYRGKLKEFKFKMEISDKKDHEYWLKFLLSKYS